MFPFWDAVIAPLVEITGPRRVVEIGALRGDTTSELLESLGEGAELHVVDPVPQFDPGEHERQFPGRYIFHRALSLDVLADLALVDLALVDGDHNWYTVTHELELLERRAVDTDAPGPVFVLHDVSWPYGRRDGYYDMTNIPLEFRQPCAQQGIVRGQSVLSAEGGSNRHVWNASHEGGARNGVLTALEDFVAAHERNFEVVVIDLYTGLAIAADAPRVAAQPELSTFFDELRSDAGKQRLQTECETVVRAALASGALTISSLQP